jgi:hypothetical protein
LHHVTSLELELTAIPPFAFGGDPLCFFSSWVAAFPPGIEHVSFIGNWFASTEFRAKVLLVQLVSEACPRLRTVKLNDEQRSVAAWLADDA